MTVSQASACLENELVGRNNSLSFIVIGPINDQSKLATGRTNTQRMMLIINVIILIYFLFNSSCIGNHVVEEQISEHYEWSYPA